MMKRSSRGEAKRTGADIKPDTEIGKRFQQHQQQLDDKHDRHERILKLSRDITIDSKRTIFVLQRTARQEERDTAIAEAQDKLSKLRQTKWQHLAKELFGQDPYQYMRAYSPGLQEYIEAVSLLHYIEKGTLVELKEIQDQLTFHSLQDMTQNDNKTTTVESAMCEDEILTVHVPPIEYILGVADLTGELMRMAISSVSIGKLDVTREYCTFIRTLYDSFVSLGNISREVTRKVSTLRQSLHKVETACYTVQVRGSEIPKHMLAAVLTEAKPDHSFVDHEEIH